METSTVSTTATRTTSPVLETASAWPDKARTIGTLQPDRTIVLTTDDEYKTAGEWLVAIKQLKAAVVADFADSKKKAYEAWQAICSQERGHIEKLEDAEEVIGGGMVGLERVRAEAARIEAERRQREIDRKAREDREREVKAKEREAAKAPTAAVRDETLREARALAAAPVQTTTVQVDTGLAKIAGLTTKETWRAEVYDLRTLVRAWLNGDVPKDVIIANEKACNREANSFKADFNKPIDTKGRMRLPGVKAVKDESKAGTTAGRKRS